jgi:hypothetical protein
VLTKVWLARAVAGIAGTLSGGQQSEGNGLTCPAAADGCIPNSQCTSCHSSCLSSSCMSNSSGQVCTDDDCTACPDGFYLLPRVVHSYENIPQFSEVSAAAKVKKSLADVDQVDLPHMQRLYAYQTGLRFPVSGMCRRCPGSATGCEKCQIVGPGGGGFRSWRCVQRNHQHLVHVR